MGLSVSARGPLFLLTSFTAGQTLGGPARLRGVGLVFAVTHGAPPRASAVVMPVCGACYLHVLAFSCGVEGQRVLFMLLVFTRFEDAVVIGLLVS